MAGERRALTIAMRAAERAGRIAMRSFGRRIRAELKPDSTPVTAYDRALEEELRRLISREFPEDGFVGEEYGSSRARSGSTWIVDPIDGTKSFIRGIPFWGVMVAREKEGKLTLGVVHLPALGDTLYAWRGGGAFLNRRRIRVSRVKRLAEAGILHGDLDCFANTRSLPRLGRIVARSRSSRGYGDCWGYTWLTSGRAEAVIEAKMNPWDVAAPKVIVEEAGGTMTDWKGRDDWRISNSLATNGFLHRPILRLLARK